MQKQELRKEWNLWNFSRKVHDRWLIRIICFTLNNEKIRKYVKKSIKTARECCFFW